MALIRHLEGIGSWNLVEVRQVVVLVRNQVAVQVVVQVRLWDLVFHDNCIRYELHDSAGHYTQTETSVSNNDRDRVTFMGSHKDKSSRQADIKSKRRDKFEKRRELKLPEGAGWTQS